ncbi:MAG: hypothetical protein ACE5J3_02535 [Methanosarcinales archaeon]
MTCFGLFTITSLKCAYCLKKQECDEIHMKKYNFEKNFIERMQEYGYSYLNFVERKIGENNGF